jgi:hypothetical protein
MINTLKKAEPTHQDVMAALFVGKGHPYWSQEHHRYDAKNACIVITDADRDYSRLLEVVICRERQLADAVDLLSEAQRERLGV